MRTSLRSILHGQPWPIRAEYLYYWLMCRLHVGHIMISDDRFPVPLYPPPPCSFCGTPTETIDRSDASAPADPAIRASDI